MDTASAGRGTLIAGVSGLLLFIFMFFSWYGPPDEIGGVEVPTDQLEAAGVDTSISAWQAFDIIDLILLVAVIVAVGVMVIEMTGASVSLPVAGSALTAGLGAFCFLLVLYRLIDPPGDSVAGQDISLSRDIGIWLGLLATAGITYGGYEGMQEEGTSFGDVRDDVRDRTSPPPRDPGGPGDPGAPPPR
jgi:hypothetical protein